MSQVQTEGLFVRKSGYALQDSPLAEPVHQFSQLRLKKDLNL